MAQNFENNIVLTSQNPEAWLVFSYDGTSMTVEPSLNFTDEKVWVNGWDYQTIADASSAGIILDSITKIAPFHIYTTSKEDFDYNLSFVQDGSITAPVSFTSWTASPWTGTFTAFGNDIATASSSTPGNTATSNSFSVVGGVNLDGSLSYSNIGGPGTPVATFLVDESGPGFSNTTGYDPSALLWVGVGYIAFSQYIDPSATTVNFRWLITTNTGTSFAVNNYGWEQTYYGQSIIADVSLYNRPYLLSSDEFNTYETFSPLVDNEASYLLLRTNPKYSGNVKLVADTSDNLFLDTFKVSEILSNKKYRKQKVSGSSYFSGDIRTVFSSLPQGEIYRLGTENTLDLTHPKTDYSEQIITTYDYGAKMLVDELYTEEYSILAPLWINSKIPDYFVLFRLDGTYNEETYDAFVDLEDLATKFITDSALIESWNLKENSPIGKYLDNHLSELLKVESPISLSLNEYDPNTWNGVTVDKGIIAGRSEVPYFFEKITDNFTDTNAFISQGFERQNLLCPNLLNMEYIFNDNDVSSYTMSRYFGLYMAENELYKFSYYSDTSTGDDFRIISLDGRDVSAFIDSSIFSGGNIDGAYVNRIFVRNDGVDLVRVCCTEQIDGSRGSINEYVNKLGTNLFGIEVKNKSINTFISLRINELLTQGEHLRVINMTQGKIWEAYGTESEYFDAGEAGPYVSFNEPSTGYPILYRTSFSIKGDISDQAIAISNAFNLFSDYDDAPFSVGVTKDDGLSIIVNDPDDDDYYVFQRLTGQIAYSIGDPSSLFNSAAQPEDITYFGVFTPDSLDFERIPADASYGPIDFELYGDRFSIMIDMINTDQYEVYSFDNSVTELFTDNVLYIGNDGWNRLIQEFDVSTSTLYNYQHVDDPTSSEDKSLIITEVPISLDQTNVWYAYDVYPISISLMGINPVKYMDYTVYDSSIGFESNYRNARMNDDETNEIYLPFGSSKTLTGRDSFIITEGIGNIVLDGSTINYNVTPPNEFPFNTFFGLAAINATANTTIKYNTLDGSFNYTSYDSNISEENLDDYYQENYLIDGSGNQYPNKIELKYGLVVPTITKWGAIGNDVRDNPVRLMLTNYLFDDPSTINSNFIPVSDTSLYTNEVSYPVFKYLSSGGESWKSYVYYDINDVVDYNGERKSIRDIMFDDPYSDIFSKILYNNNEVSGDATRSSILYYNLYENKVITILSGVKLGIEVTSAGEKLFNITNWDRYRFSIISSPSRNLYSNNPIEVIINKNTETILMIWYQGADNLNYNKRWSSITPGKNNLIDTNSMGGVSYMGFVTGDPLYSYVKSPFIIKTNSLTTSIVNVYDYPGVSSYDSSIVSPYAQFSYNINNQLNTLFNAYEVSTNFPGENIVTGGVFQFLKSFDSFDQNEIDYSYQSSAAAYGTNITNLSYNYINNYNYYQDKTCDIDIFKNIIENNIISYYIIEEDQIYSSNLFASQPVAITLYDPIEYKSQYSDSSIYTYNGGYRPIFKSILNFEDNETSDLINILEKDFVFANTNLQSYNSIDQYWVNRVVTTVTSSDSSNNILYKEDFNPFKSLWDADYFLLSTGSINTEIDGYQSSLELSSMFGSKLISLPDQIILDSWNAGNSKLVTKTGVFSLEYNLTKTIIDLFSNDNTFIDNWNGLPAVTDDVINRYIIKTVLRNYNISIDKIIVNVFSKPFEGEVLKKTYNSTFTTEIMNISSQLSLLNDEYIYKIEFPIADARSYFTKFTFNKK